MDEGSSNEIHSCLFLGHLFESVQVNTAWNFLQIDSCLVKHEMSWHCSYYIIISLSSLIFEAEMTDIAQIKVTAGISFVTTGWVPMFYHRSHSLSKRYLQDWPSSQVLTSLQRWELFNCLGKQLLTTGWDTSWQEIPSSIVGG